jgi:hypothetical protein
MKNTRKRRVRTKLDQAQALRAWRKGEKHRKAMILTDISRRLSHE